MTTPHDEVITELLDELGPFRGEIRLLGRVSDPLIGNSSDKEVFFFIPDLHLLSPARQRRFDKYCFNYSDSGLLVKLLTRMANVKKKWGRDGEHKLVTIQTGDFFDMWRECPGLTGTVDVPDDAHGELRDILYRGVDRGKPCLKATIILGNHDTDNGTPLQEVSFHLKTYNRAEQNNPFLFATHGDAFDILETVVPEPVKEFGVAFVGNLTPVNKYPVGNWGQHAAKINKPIKDLDQSITEPEHSLSVPAGAPMVSPGQPLPPLMCQEIMSPDQAQHGLFGKIYRSLDVAKQNNLPGQHVKIVAIGHTHKAAMVLCKPEDDKRPLVLMDVGAWIEKCRYKLAEGGEVIEPSAQLGVVHGNDARIYQIRVPAAG
jgi:UDP-2,3-diacylglucosamine pyrophosphatase LpxH